MNFLNKFSIKAKTYMLVMLSVIVALVLSFVSDNGMKIIQYQIDELLLANNIERDTYLAILEEKNYLLNSNGSVMNQVEAKKAFENSKKALKDIYTNLESINKNKQLDSKELKKSILRYDEYYKRGIFLLKELEQERRTLQIEGENITLQAQEYVEAKRIDLKNKLSQKTAEKINIGSNIWQYTYMVRANEKRYIISPNKDLYEQLKKDYAFMMSELSRLKVISNEDFEHKKIDIFYKSAKIYDSSMKKWIKHNKEHVTSILPQTKKYGDIIIAKTLDIANDSINKIDEKRAFVLKTLIIVTLLAILFGIFFGTLISRSISSVINNFQTSLIEFFNYLENQKNSAKQIEINSNDEIAIMAEVINKKIVKIEEIMNKKLLIMKQKDEQMLHQSRLAQMGEMISMIAHQWRQPLGSISSTAGNLKLKLELNHFNKENKNNDDECQKYFIDRLDNINLYVQNLTTTINDFRNFYKPNKQTINLKLKDVVIKSLAIVKASLENDNIDIITEYLESQQIDVYSSELMQVILNIIKNAQDNFRENQIENPFIKIIVKNNIIKICDNGSGIPSKAIDKIFDPYFSTKNEKVGTGLGLYMSKTIVEEHHNGYLEVENINDGACFNITIGTININATH